MKKTTYLEGNHSGVKELTESYLNLISKQDTCFSIYTIVSEVVCVDGRNVELKSDKLQIQNYILGKFYTPEDLAKEFGKNSTIYCNVAFTGLRGACKDVNGKFHAVHHEDIVLDPATIKYKEQPEDKKHYRW